MKTCNWCHDPDKKIDLDSGYCSPICESLATNKQILNKYEQMPEIKQESVSETRTKFNPYFLLLLGGSIPIMLFGVFFIDNMMNCEIYNGRTQEICLDSEQEFTTYYVFAAITLTVVFAFHPSLSPIGTE